MGSGFFGGSSSGNSTTNQAFNQQSKDTSSSSTSSPYAGPLANLATILQGIGSPIAGQLGSQYLEALRTGGVGSFLPFITRAMDAVRQGGSQSIQQLRQMLARSGFANSAMTPGTLAQANQQVNQQAAMTPSEMLQSWISGAGPFATNLISQALGGLQAAGSLTRNIQGQTTGQVSGTSTGTTSGTSSYDPGLLQWLSLGMGNPIGLGSSSLGSTVSQPLGSMWDWFSGAMPGASDFTSGTDLLSPFDVSSLPPWLGGASNISAVGPVQ